MQLKILALATLASLATSTIAQAANPDHVQRLLKTNQCPTCDLSEANLKEANLFGANLVGANLKGADLSSANLGSANLTDVDLSGAKLGKAYLHLAILENTNLSNADLTGAYLRDASLAEVNFKGANLQGVNLSRTTLAGSNLQGVDLSGANLSNTTMTQVRVPGVSSRSELLQFSYFFLLGSSSSSSGGPSCQSSLPEEVRQQGFSFALTDLSGANLKGANLNAALMPYTNLTSADLSNANLRDAVLICSKLNNATLDGADLKNARLDGAVLQGASLKNVKNADLARTFPSEDAVQQAPIQSEAKTYVGSMNRAQQAYYLERNEFSTNLQDLGLGIPSDTENYSYRVFAYRDRQRAVMLAGVPKKSGFKTYIGFVNIGTMTQTGETITLAVLCESEEAKPMLPKLPSSLPKSTPVPCPAGFQTIR